MVGLLSLFAFAYIQNIAFALASRSRNRSSLMYHFVAVMLASLVFFWMLRRLVTNDLTLVFLLPYISGTVLGSLTGAQISTWIEKKIGAVAHIDGASFTKRNFLGQAWPLLALFFTLAIWIFFSPSELAWTFILVTGLLFVQNLSYTVLSRAGNRNKPTFLLVAALLNGVVQFFIYQRLVAYKMDWLLFLPYAAGSIAGSVSGAFASMKIEKKIGASPDAHARGGEGPRLVALPIALVSFFVLIECLILQDIQLPLLTLYGLAVAQNFSFMVVSRARNRNRILYHAVASVFSNAIWFVTFRELYVTGLTWPFLVPYVAGLASGSLLALHVATWIEQKIGAVSDTSVLNALVRR